MTNQFIKDHPVYIFIPLYIVRFGEYNLWIVENRAVKNQILSSVQCHRQTITSITFILVMRSECSLNLYIYIFQLFLKWIQLIKLFNFTNTLYIRSNLIEKRMVVNISATLFLSWFVLIEFFIQYYSLSSCTYLVVLKYCFFLYIITKYYIG